MAGGSGRRRGRGEGWRRGALGILQIRAAAQISGGRRGRSGDEAAAVLWSGGEEKRLRGAPVSWWRRPEAAHREEAAGTAISDAEAHVDDGGEVAEAGEGGGGWRRSRGLLRASMGSGGLAMGPSGLAVRWSGTGQVAAWGWLEAAAGMRWQHPIGRSEVAGGSGRVRR